MEKTLSPDERIKRAEEIYYRRKMQDETRKTARVNVSNKKDLVLFKKIILQIIVCIIIYSIFYIIQNANYMFSEDLIKKTNELLSYDINITKLYNQTKKYLNSVIIKKSEGINKEGQNIEQLNYDENLNINENQNINPNTNENIESSQVVENNIDNESIGGEEVKAKEEEPIVLSQMEEDAKDIINTKSLTIPLKGTITSRYGPRNSDNPIVTKNHTGIDIAVNEGTVFVASMSGTVEEVSSIGDLGNHIKIVSDDVMTVYAHCKTIYVKEGDKVSQGQQIGEVGSTGNVTGPHLHFEIRKENRYVDPDLILEFN